MKNIQNPANERLVESVKAYLENRSQENYQNAIQTLIDTIKENGKIFIPVRKSNVGSKEEYVVPSTLSASDGQWYYIAYTSEKEARMSQEEGMTVMDLSKILEMSGTTSGCGGLCFDPWDRNGLFIPGQYMSVILDAADESTNNQI